MQSVGAAFRPRPPEDFLSICTLCLCSGLVAVGSPCLAACPTPDEYETNTSLSIHIIAIGREHPAYLPSSTSRADPYQQPHCVGLRFHETTYKQFSPNNERKCVLQIDTSTKCICFKLFLVCVVCTLYVYFKFSSFFFCHHSMIHLPATYVLCELTIMYDMGSVVAVFRAVKI